jgi:LmbE family N-acetylglucosaminyl deacetylase
MRRERVLGIFAHPDDESLVAGGTLAACAAAGMEVALLCLTRGEQGPIADPRLVSRETLGAVREGELRAAADVLGVGRVECLRYPDGELPWVDRCALEADLARSIAGWRPAAVLTFGADGLYWHPDHIAVHDATLAVLRRLAGDGCSIPAYQATWPGSLMPELAAAMAARGLAADLWGLKAEDFGVPAGSISTIVDVHRFVATKLRALRSHRTQLAPDHVLQVIPDDLAERFFGREYFIRARRRRSIRRGRGAPPESDWLTSALAREEAATR